MIQHFTEKKLNIKEINLIKIYINAFAELIMENLKQYMEQNNNDTEEMISDKFDLHAKIISTFQFFKEVQDDFQAPCIDQLYESSVSKWLNFVRQKLTDWTMRILEKEEWKPISEEQDGGILYSAGVIDLFSACYQAFDYLKLVNINLEKTSETFSSIVCDVVLNYVNLISKSCLDIIEEDQKSTKWEDLEDMNAEQLRALKNLKVNILFTEAICIRLNNIARTRVVLDEYSNDILKYICEENKSNIKKNLFVPTLLKIKEETIKIINGLTALIDKDIKKSLYFVAHEDGEYEQKTSPLFNYINFQMSTLSVSLYYTVLVDLQKKNVEYTYGRSYRIVSP